MSIATVEVSLSALNHNLERLHAAAPHSQIAAILKANAYGHGMIEIAKHLKDKVACLGVARLSEAIALRQAGIHSQILLLEGCFPHENVECVVEYGLQTVIHSPEQIEQLKTVKFNTPITVWFKLDTGMHRLGFRPEEAQHYFHQLALCDSVRKPINIATHFCCADELESAITPTQIKIFDQFITSIEDKNLIGLQSLAASGGIFAWPQAHRDMIRPGIVLYGVSPFAFNCPGKSTGHELGLKPVMTFKSELIAVRKHKQGESVGYGQIWTSSEDTLLGVVAMGYGDGYPRSIPDKTPVLINGRRVPIVGRVSMDMVLVDLGAGALDKSGDEVIFWGEGLPIEEIAHHTNISAYELLTSLTIRAKIRYTR